MFTVNRWNPFEELATLHRDMDRVFSRQHGETTSRQADQAWTPPIEIASQPEGWHVRVALPGIDPGTVRIDLHGNTLKIAGERTGSNEKETESYHSEFAYGPFERAFTLPSSVDAEAVSAAYNQGMLELTLPLAEAAKPRRIEIGGQLKDIDVRKLA